MRIPASDIADMFVKLSSTTYDVADADARRATFWKQLPEVSDVVGRYLKQVTGRASYLEQVTIYVDDPSFRQSAAAMILEYRFDVSDELTVRAIYLVDQSQISVTVLRSATTVEFEPVARQIGSEA